MGLGAAEIGRALRAATDCFFCEAAALDAALGLKAAEALGDKMHDYLNLIGMAG